MSNRYLVCASNNIREWIPPVSLYSFNSNVSAHDGTFSSGTREAPVLDTGASDVDGFYNGYNIFNTVTGENRQIVGYNGTTKTVQLDIPFSASWDVTNTFEIKDPSNWFNVHLQHTASSSDGFYNGTVLVDMQTRNYVGIYAYNGALKIASISSPFPPESLM